MQEMGKLQKQTHKDIIRAGIDSRGGDWPLIEAEKEWQTENMGLNKDTFSFDNVNTRDPSASVFKQSYQIRERACK